MTQALKTRYLPASDRRHSRVVALWRGKVVCYVPYDSQLDDGQNHSVAAAEALTRLNLPGEWVFGRLTEEECVFVRSFRDAKYAVVMTQPSDTGTARLARTGGGW